MANSCMPKIAYHAPQNVLMPYLETYDNVHSQIHLVNKCTFSLVFENLRNTGDLTFPIYRK